MSDIKQKAVSGVKWNTTATLIMMLIQILRLSVLTRLLDKSDFGLIAISTMVIGFTDIFSELGLTVAIIHKQNISDKQYSSIYWTNIILSLFVFCILCLLSPIVALFYKQPILSTIIPILGIQILLNSFGKMFQTLKSKNMEFAFLSKVRIFACIIGFIITIVFAVHGWGIYSLVLGQLIQVAIMQLIYTYVGRKEQKILLYLNFREISDFIKIGSFRLGSQILDFISSKIDVFLIGKFFGMDDLGFYNLAKDLIVRPFSMINMLTNNVASSAFAQIQNNISLVDEYYRKIVNIVSTIVIPSYFIFFISADLIVFWLYGANFSEVALLIRILVFYGIECSISSQGSLLQVALGKTNIGFKWTFVRILLTIVVIIAASKFSIQAVAIGQLLLSIVSVYLFWFIAIRPIIKLDFISYQNTFSLPLGVSILCAMPILIVSLLVNLSIWWQIGYSIAFSVLYMLYYWSFENRIVSNFFGLIFTRGNR